MGGGKPAKSNAGAKRPAARKSSKNAAARVRDLEKRLAEALKREAEALGKLQTRDHELVEAQEQQTATSDILRVISSSPTDVQPVFDAIVRSGQRLLNGDTTNVLRVVGNELQFAAMTAASEAAAAEVRATFPVPLTAAGVATHVIRTRRSYIVADIETDPLVTARLRHTASLRGFRSMLMVPMVHHEQVIGVITVTRRSPGAFTDDEIALLQTFADQAVIAIENVRLFKELQASNRALTEALEQQTSTSDILRVISQSPTDVQPVVDAVAENAARLCDAQDVSILEAAGGLFRVVAYHGASRLRDFEGTPVTRGSVAGRAILDGQVIHVHDITDESEAAFPVSKAIAQHFGHRTMLAVPLLREGTPLGTIFVRQTTVRPFSDKQIGLLQTFADQAVIAIENVRLFTELQEKNQALTQAHAQVSESLEQQTATAEILRVISRSQVAVQPVFDTIVASAVRLCRAHIGVVYQFDGAMLRLVAHHNLTPEMLDAVTSLYPRAPQRDTISGRAILSRAVVQIEDVLADREFHRGLALATSWRSMVSVPMLREGEPIGAIVINRIEPGAFADNHLDLLKTFADQAVIAIENVRLFKELEARNRDLTTALDQQTATSEILRVISSSPTDVQPVLDTVVASAARFCGAYDVTLFRVDGDSLRFPAHYGPIPVPEEGSIPLIRGHVSGRSVLERRVVHLTDVQAEAAEFPEGAAYAQRHGHRTIVAAPLLREGAAIGALLLRRGEASPFSDKQIALLQTFADQAVIAIENVRLFKELEARNRDLTEALEQQTATSDVLRIIAQSPTELQPVLDAIASSAVRLCAASDVVIERLEGDRFYNAAHAGTQMKDLIGHPLPLTRRFPGGRAVLDRRPVIIDDIMPVAENEYPDTLDLLKLNTVHSCAEIPLLSEGRSLGNLAVLRAEVRPFTDAEVALLQTFADQAVIAIENVRLFKELEARTHDLTRSVDELTALGEVGRALSSTLNLEDVLQTIAKRATQLTETAGCVIWEYDKPREAFRLRVSHYTDDSDAAILPARGGETTISKGQGLTTQVMEERQPVQIPDIAVEGAYESPVRKPLIDAGHRALLGVPLLSGDEVVGVLAVTRKTPGEFDPEVIRLLSTFANQSALAIQNARLFQDIEEKSRQLEVASQHKSEFLANMSHELRTPLNAIIGFSEVLTDRMFGELNEKQEEYLKDIYASGTHLLSLINDILDLSKIEAGRMELELTDFHLPTALDNALTLVRERAGRRSITLQTSIDEQLGEIRADERKIRQVVLNLLSNAIKFTPEGGRIEVGAVPKDGFVEVSVSDTGVGIAPEDQERVFEEFRQVGTAEKKAEGTGLGLTLCRKFIELHRGRIWVKSQVGVGSTFTFTLPVGTVK